MVRAPVGPYQLRSGMKNLVLEIHARRFTWISRSFTFTPCPGSFSREQKSSLKIPTWLAKPRTSVQRVGLPPSRVKPGVCSGWSHDLGWSETERIRRERSNKFLFPFPLFLFEYKSLVIWINSRFSVEPFPRLNLLGFPLDDETKKRMSTWLSSIFDRRKLIIVFHLWVPG